ncbi:amino acid ABC transporter permease [Sulfitobacter pseudonitzschiae]|jgi:polar amino acid transport system permease protein|nr:amino acid ABC transporter permease [Pseudosulfitobacter pseudonitzschiae]MBM2299780.1 amino acid ABC transporter permease [Pseudosulfitobacter pseudonitzschiae]MBM2304680.1 amino acid ABC transporter permease [Pseudosulfitobacter pseudonitzschiae]MBM2362394.1 amino acid ABC transporter permease [Pseudosulfitobacter pseudonitzschiae]MBM2381358.1 amino acid ABC transporter permease [Pseudosulfitobacter pseudonitzschiae]MBM2386269.1 amino acid ABC transporter permease [Pseudosulfitobacter pse|tara:strand:+ start:18691 stop:19353 length:663 start_codon:yes stop_codon:yes gene_type:complete
MFPTSSELSEWLPRLLDGLKVSVQVAGLSITLGVLLGMMLALCVMSKSAWIRWSALLVVEIGRGAPALVLLQFIYFGLPNTGLTLGSFAAAVIALAWNTGAYTSEIIRGAIQAVPDGQREASVSLGLSPFQEMRDIILPQALRIALPPLLGFAILIFQGTTLCFTIALPELVSKAYYIGSNTFRYLPAIVAAGGLYVAICLPASFFVAWMERRASRHATH